MTCTQPTFINTTLLLIALAITKPTCANTATVFNPTGIEYPVRPNHLTFGTFKDINIDSEAIAPQMIFVMGNESVTMQWLKANQEYFTKHGAIGFLIRADHRNEIHQIRRLTGFDQLFLYPTVDDLIEQYPVPHYPFVIDTHRRMIRQ